MRSIESPYYISGIQTVRLTGWANKEILKITEPFFWSRYYSHHFTANDWDHAIVYGGKTRKEPVIALPAYSQGYKSRLFLGLICPGDNYYDNQQLTTFAAQVIERNMYTSRWNLIGPAFQVCGNGDLHITDLFTQYYMSQNERSYVNVSPELSDRIRRDFPDFVPGNFILHR